jgi:CubicO group peptidase (beta-lactamase class C family)
LIKLSEVLSYMPGNATDRITRVITDLRPTTTLLHGQTAPCSLSDRMVHFASPGASVAVIDEGRVAWERGFGMRTNGKAEPVGADTLFQAGSVSKAVFALGAMRLVQDGHITLDSDIQQYLTSWRIPANGGWTPHATLRQLLSHTAGVSVHGFAGYPATGPWPTLTQTLNGSPPANNFPVIVDLIPGLQFRYSGGGTTIAQAAVTDVLGRPLPDIMRELTFDRMALESTTFAQPLPLDLAARSATAHPWNGVPMPGRWRVHPEMAAAGLWTTAGDLARIGCAFLDSLHGDHSTLGLSLESSAAMLEPQLPTDLQGGDFVGLGWYCTGDGDAFQCYHLGWNEGFVAGLWLYPALGQGAAVMINSNQGWPLRDEIKEAIAREYDWQRATTKTVQQQLPTAVEGTYHTERGAACEVAIDGTRLTLRINKQPTLAFVLKEAGFVSSSVNASLQFLPTMEAATTMVLNQEGKTFRFQK